jgi:hypothetical protein
MAPAFEAMLFALVWMLSLLVEGNVCVFCSLLAMTRRSTMIVCLVYPLGAFSEVSTLLPEMAPHFKFQPIIVFVFNSHYYFRANLHPTGFLRG